MSEDRLIDGKTRINYQLWSHHNILYWVTFSLSLFCLLISGGASMLQYKNYNIDILNVGFFVLLSLISVLFFIIIRNFYQLMIQEAQQIRLYSESVSEGMYPPKSAKKISRFAENQMFILIGSIYYFFIALFTIMAIVIFFEITISYDNIFFSILVLIAITLIIILYIPWIIMLKKTVKKAHSLNSIK